MILDVRKTLSAIFCIRFASQIVVMKKVTLFIGLLSALLILSQCAPRPVSSAPKLTPEQEVAEVKKAYAPEQIAKGKDVFENKCEECHELHQPGSYQVHSWVKILPKMSRKAKLSPEQAGVLKAWVLTNAKPG